jgi:hypothetical protein
MPQPSSAIFVGLSDVIGLQNSIHRIQKKVWRSPSGTRDMLRAGHAQGGTCSGRDMLRAGRARVWHVRRVFHRAENRPRIRGS